MSLKKLQALANRAAEHFSRAAVEYDAAFKAYIKAHNAVLAFGEAEVARENERTVSRIALAIRQAAEDCMEGKLSVEGCCEKTKVLWGEARAAGLANKVDAVIQAHAAFEFQEALEELDATAKQTP